MPVTTWMVAETFYNVSLPIMVIISLITFLILVFVLSYANWTKARYIVLLFILGLIASGVYSVEKHTQYAAYLEEYSLINPLIRDRRIIFGYPFYYSSRERRVYTQLHDIESLRNLSMYQEKLVVEELHYLGKKDYFHYNGEIFKTAKKVTYTKSTTYAQIIGSQFSLVDDYQTIGFNKELKPMFNTIIINEDSKDTLYEPISESQVLLEEIGFSNWNF